jgi:hypothetical protein
MNSPGPPTSGRRDWWVLLGMTVTALSAAISSFSGLRALAQATGWPEPLSPLLPCTIDAYAMTATRVWLARSTRSERARCFARWNALVAVGLSLIGNATWHLIAAKVIEMTWPVIVLVGAVPPAVLGLLSHLAILRSEVDNRPATTARPPNPPSEDEDGPEVDQLQDEHHDEVGGEDDLLAAARAAAAAHYAQHGRPISRDALRHQLHVSTDRATVLLRQLKASRPQTKQL